MSAYELIQLKPCGELFAVETRINGRIFATEALTQHEADGDFTDFNYDEEVNAAAYDLGIFSTDTESEDPMGSTYRVTRSL